MGSWSELDGDVFRMMAEERVTSLEDQIRLEAVCKNWRFELENSCLRGPQLPWLMLPYCQQHESCRGFYSISEGKTHHIEFPRGYDEKRCVGSSHGWLVMMEETTPFIFLVKPLTKQRIDLPPLSSFPDVSQFHSDQVGREYLVLSNGFEYEHSMKEMTEFYISKVILSCDPTLDNCIAVAIYGDRLRLAYCRVGHDNKWTEVHNEFIFQDEVIYWKGAFYAAGHTGSLLVFHLPTASASASDSDSPKVDVIIERNNATEISDTGSGRYYLVADSVLDELLLICKEIGFHDDHPYRTIKIKVYTLDEEKKLWERRQCLGDKVLFLGYNYTLCFSAADFQELKPNTIYFTDDFLEGYEKGEVGGHDTSIFDMADGTFKPLPCCDPQASFIWPPPVWVTPSRTAG